MVTVRVAGTLVQPPEVIVYVMVAEPAATPVMTPVVALIVAMAALPEVQVPPETVDVNGDNVSELPAHMV